MSDAEPVRRRRSPSPPDRRVRQRRDDNNQRQNGVGGGNQMNPFANNPPPPSLPAALRILMIDSRNDVVSVLSEISRSHREAIYILSGVGYVRDVILTELPSAEQLSYPTGIGQIHNLTGWFQPIMIDSGWAGAFSRPNGILHVCVSGGPRGVSVANRLIVSEFVQVYVVFICAPGTRIRPDPWGADPTVIPIPSPPPPPQ